jgi:hypothetical protein
VIGMLRVEEALSGGTDGVDAEQLWDWVRPPEGGFTADDLDRIPGLPRR